MLPPKPYLSILNHQADFIMNTILAWALGGPEMMVILLIVLLLFGAKKLPQLARGMGKSLGEFKKAKQEFEDEITRAEDEVKTEVKS